MIAFRTHWSAAPLKPRVTSSASIRVISFPHSLECGSVEALRSECYQSIAMPFRTHWSAAPLKPCGLGEIQMPHRTFRTHWSAAPLKRLEFDQFLARLHQLSALTGVRLR